MFISKTLVYIAFNHDIEWGLWNLTPKQFLEERLINL